MMQTTTSASILVVLLLYFRSALKKIFERDDTPNRNLVLCVSAICSEARMMCCFVLRYSILVFLFFRILILVDRLHFTMCRTIGLTTTIGLYQAN